MRAEFLHPSRKVALFALFSGSILLGVASGPASAVLLTPRLQLWPAGHTQIWVNATSDQIWPAHYACPSSEWYNIRDYFSVAKQTPPPRYIDRYALAEGPFMCPIHGQNSVRQLRQAEDESFIGSGPRPQITTTQQAVVADALATTGALWFLSLTNVTATSGHGTALSDQSDATHTIAKNYSQPYSTVVCVPDRIRNASDFRNIALPILLNANSPDLANGNLTFQGHTSMKITKTLKHPDFFYHQLLDTPGPAREYRLRWIELPEPFFEGSSIGAAILFPKVEKSPEQDLLLCNLAAGWGPASVTLHSRAVGIGSVSDRMRSGNITSGPNVPTTMSKIPNAEDGSDAPDWFEFNYPHFPERVINISDTWAQYLNPVVENLNTSLIHLLMQQQIYPSQQYVSASGILSMLMVNGLARVGWGSVVQGDIKTVGPNGTGGLDGNYWLSGKGDVFNVDHVKSQDWVTFRVDSTLKGYAYNTLTAPPRVAIAILSAYCLLVIGQMLYCGITGISSSCWDTIAEVTALAMNSTPTAALRNTCAGISELHIFKLPVRVLVSNDEEGEGEHLELVFGQVDEEKMKEKTIVANRTYGTLPKGAKEEGKKNV
ncbi:MAG: hypothetical protein Q9179_003455 [Wetmoreana sp. 5 TL-2023]